MKKKSIIIAVTSVLVLGIGGVCAGFAWQNYNRYEVKQDKITVELGETLNVNLADYIEANEKALEETKLDTSKVDTMKAGSYKISATWKEHTAGIEVIVKDTVVPQITLKSEKDIKVMVGEELKATELVEKVEDLAGIKTVSFDKNQIKLKSDSKNLLDKLGLKFNTAGKQTVKFIVEDNNGNKSEAEITVNVIEDYLAHVSGFADITTEQGTKPDWMKNIVRDEKIAEITVDESAVDINTPGEYQLKYIITGDDGETTLEQTVKVIVKEKPKPKEVQQPKNTSKKADSNNSGSSTPAGGNSNSGSSESGGGSNSGSWLDSLTPGDSWVSETTDEGTCESTGINGESGTW